MNKGQHISKIMKTSEILALIQPDMMIKSSLNIPLYFDENLNRDDLYDPRFFLPLICQLCASDQFVDKHLKLIESGALGLAFASLSSRDEQIRQIGIVSLHRYVVTYSAEHLKTNIYTYFKVHCRFSYIQTP